jgi:large subunit ribosomal protein L6
VSRIGRKPVAVPAGVTVEVKGDIISAKGAQGELSRTLPPGITAVVEDGHVVVSRASEEPRHKALHGLSRTLIANMLEGVARGYLRVLEIQGVGYKAEASKSGLRLALGFSHPVDYPAPAGIKLTVENNTIVKVAGPSKELVGQVAAELRSLRPPEPYKGKGVRYQGEQVRRKAGKTGAK